MEKIKKFNIEEIDEDDFLVHISTKSYDIIAYYENNKLCTISASSKSSEYPNIEVSNNLYTYIFDEDESSLQDYYDNAIMSEKAKKILDEILDNVDETINNYIEKTRLSL